MQEKYLVNGVFVTSHNKTIVFQKNMENILNYLKGVFF